jgi:hypothetical protein
METYKNNDGNRNNIKNLNARYIYIVTMNCLCMPKLPGYEHVTYAGEMFNIPKTTKGPEVEKCLATCYPHCRSGHGEDKDNKRICAASCHKFCG